jgi:hypothetical protein
LLSQAKTDHINSFSELLEALAAINQDRILSYSLKSIFFIFKNSVKNFKGPRAALLFPQHIIACEPFPSFIFLL